MRRKIITSCCTRRSSYYHPFSRLFLSFYWILLTIFMNVVPIKYIFLTAVEEGLSIVLPNNFCDTSHWKKNWNIFNIKSAQLKKHKNMKKKWKNICVAFVLVGRNNTQSRFWVECFSMVVWLLWVLRKKSSSTNTGKHWAFLIFSSCFFVWREGLVCRERCITKKNNIIHHRCNAQENLVTTQKSKEKSVCFLWRKESLSFW